eukprot:gene7205-8011_t
MACGSSLFREHRKDSSWAGPVLRCASNNAKPTVFHVASNEAARKRIPLMSVHNEKETDRNRVRIELD